MATNHRQLCDDKGNYIPYFEKKLIDENRKDGYWIEAFKVDNQSPIGLIAYGLGEGKVNFYQNPCTTAEPGTTTLIQELDGPVGMDQADITGNGFNDIVICYQYGKSMKNLDEEGGKIIWLENPGESRDQKPWTQHYVGKSKGMHRLKVGHFTQTERWEILGMPVTSKHGDLFAPVPVLLFRQPDDVLNATKWSCEIINDDFFRIIHDAKKFNVNSLDQLLIASCEGINWYYFDEKSKKWNIENIGKGEPKGKWNTDFYGCGCVDAGKVENDSFAYIATVDPFHGNVVAVYIKNTNNCLKHIEWKRYVLDIYGQPNEHGESPGHYIVCADFDKDGNDEFLVALRGPSPNQGVYYYKPIDLSRGLFAKWKVSDDSAARIAVADFDNDGFLDFATIAYCVPGYYEAENPSINIYYNRFTNKIQVTKQNNELLFKVPRPNKALQYETLPFLSLGGITLSLEVIPPFSSREIKKNTYIKVLFGIIMWTDSSKNVSQSVQYSRTCFCQPKSVSSLEIHSDENRITTGNEGALLIVFKMYEAMKTIPRFDSIENTTVDNVLPEYCSEETRKLDFQFIKYNPKNFKNFEFHNMKGFYIKFADNGDDLCHMQLWAAGKGTNAGVHNHSDAKFCEVHACIVNGTGKGGMQYLKSSTEDYDPSTTLDSEFERLDVPSFYEHGPLWDIDEQKKPIFRNDGGSVRYPWHVWKSGNVDSFKESFDIWIAFEYNPQLSKLD